MPPYPLMLKVGLKGLHLAIRNPKVTLAAVTTVGGLAIKGAADLAKNLRK